MKRLTVRDDRRLFGKLKSPEISKLRVTEPGRRKQEKDFFKNLINRMPIRPSDEKAG